MSRVLTRRVSIVETVRFIPLHRWLYARFRALLGFPPVARKVSQNEACELARSVTWSS